MKAPNKQQEDLGPPHVAVKSHRCPHAWFTPTHLELGSAEGGSDEYHAVWSSRRSRKARYTPVSHTIVPSNIRHGSGDHAERGIAEVEQAMINLRVRTERHIKPSLNLDVTFWLAATFTIGSAFWVVNGFLVWFPILRPGLESETFTNTATATAFIGGTIFEVGSYLMVLEALNRGHEAEAGEALGQLLHHHRKGTSGRVTTLAQPQAGTGERGDTTRGKTEPAKLPEESSTWLWWGTPRWHDLGYLAAVIQLAAATVFWISTLTGLPGVISGLYGGDGSVPVIDIFFWTPQVVGGIGFIVSSSLLILEVQTKWYRPSLGDIGWYIGVWNLVGAVGFTLCGALGYASNVSTGATYQSGLSTWWGGWAFLIGSVLQLGEAVWREKPAARQTKD